MIHTLIFPILNLMLKEKVALLLEERKRHKGIFKYVGWHTLSVIAQERWFEEQESSHYSYIPRVYVSGEAENFIPNPPRPVIMKMRVKRKR